MPSATPPPDTRRVTGKPRVVVTRRLLPETEARMAELFDVVLLPGVRCPMSLGIDSDEIRATITHSSALPPDTDQKAPG